MARGRIWPSVKRPSRRGRTGGPGRERFRNGAAGRRDAGSDRALCPGWGGPRPAPRPFRGAQRTGVLPPSSGAEWCGRTRGPLAAGRGPTRTTRGCGVARDLCDGALAFARTRAFASCVAGGPPRGRRERGTPTPERPSRTAGPPCLGSGHGPFERDVASKNLGPNDGARVRGPPPGCPARSIGRPPQPSAIPRAPSEKTSLREPHAGPHAPRSGEAWSTVCLSKSPPNFRWGGRPWHPHRLS